MDNPALSSPPIAILSCMMSSPMYLKPTGVSCRRNLVSFRKGVDQVGRGNGLRHAVLPSAALDQVVKQQGDDIVRLNKCSVGIDYAEAIGVTIGRDPDVAPVSFIFLLRSSSR